MFISATLLSLLVTGFPICTAGLDQLSPSVIAAQGQYYVFWADRRDYTTPGFLAGVYGSRVALDGTVLDFNGKRLYEDSTRDESPRAAFDGANLLLVVRDGC